jgi:hypothetical protein
MKKPIFIFDVVMCGALASLLGAFIYTSIPPAKALDNPLGELKSVIAFSCGTTATSLPTAGSRADSVTLVNSAGNDVYIGGSDVTTSSEASVGATGSLGKAFTFDGKRAWCIAASAEPVTILYATR